MSKRQKKKERELNYRLLITIIILLSVIIRLFYWSYDTIWWDPAVYIEMGKYLYSAGNSGLWETSRPLMLPAILGFFWKIGINPYTAGRAMDIIYSAGLTLFTFLIAKEIFSKKTAAISALFIAFTPTIFNQSLYAATEIPATLFSIISIYLLIKKRYLFAGMLSGLAFMTRFLQLFSFIAILIFLSIKLAKEPKKKEQIKNAAILVTGFAIPVLPYIIFNIIAYHNPIHTFLQQVYMTSNTGQPWHLPLSFYTINILKENYLTPLILLSFVHYKKAKPKEKGIILTAFAIFSIFYSTISQKEMRFLISLMPFMYMLLSLGLLYITDKIKNSRVRKTIISILLIAFIIISIPQYGKSRLDDRYTPYWQYMAKKDVTGIIWITNPVFAVNTNKKAEPIYYDVFRIQKIKELQQKLSDEKQKPDHILLDSCDIDCSEQEKECPEMLQQFIEDLKTDYHTEYEQKAWICERYILSKE